MRLKHKRGDINSVYVPFCTNYKSLLGPLLSLGISSYL